jgi:serine/threonine-protein kinase
MIDALRPLPDPASDIEAAPTSLSQFEIVRVLASHEGISTYLAIRKGEAGFSRRVLLKLADQPFDVAPDVSLRLNDEARIGMRLSHVNLASLLDLGWDGGRYFLVREWVDGLGLRRLMRDRWDDGGTLPESVVLRVGIHTCRALAYLHGLRANPWAPRGITHRAVTPSSILLSTSGEVRLANLSLADPSERFDALARPVDGGVPAYLAPEVAGGRRPDHRADMFSLGAVLWEALIGPAAFEGDAGSDWTRWRADLDLAEQIASSSLDLEVRDVLCRATSSERAQRTPTARHLKDDLARLLRDRHRDDGRDVLRALVHPEA